MKRLVTLWTLLFAFSAALEVSADAFAYVKVGDVVENVELKTLDGGKQKLLGKAKANVFVFFRPGQKNSRTALEALAECEKDLKGKSVRWVAIVSDRYSADEVRAELKATGIKMKVLIDRNDALYGKLGAALHPVMGITGKDRKLVAYQPFRKVNFKTVVMARVQHQLGELTDKELASVLNPPKTDRGGGRAKAERQIKMGRAFYRSKKYDKALAAAEKATKLDPEFAAAYTLAGQVHAAQGNCDEAGEVFRQGAEDRRRRRSSH